MKHNFPSHKSEIKIFFFRKIIEMQHLFAMLHFQEFSILFFCFFFRWKIIFLLFLGRSVNRLLTYFGNLCNLQNELMTITIEIIYWLKYTLSQHRQNIAWITVLAIDWWCRHGNSSNQTESNRIDYINYAESMG